jgi:hypothetical protein
VVVAVTMVAVEAACIVVEEGAPGICLLPALVVALQPAIYPHLRLASRSAVIIGLREAVVSL